MRAVDGAFCRWVALLRQQSSALVRGAAPASTLAPGGQRRRFVLDYVNDSQLAPLRMRFAAVRLRPAEGLHQLVQCGADYAARLHAQGVWSAWLNGGSSGGALPPELLTPERA